MQWEKYLNVAGDGGWPHTHPLACKPLPSRVPRLRHDPRGRDGVPPMYRIGKERPHVWVTDPARSIVLEVSHAIPGRGQLKLQRRKRSGPRQG